WGLGSSITVTPELPGSRPTTGIPRTKRLYARSCRQVARTAIAKTTSPNAASARRTAAATLTVGYVKCWPPITISRAPLDWRCTEPAADPTASPVASRPQTPSASSSPKTNRWSRGRWLLLVAGKALKLATAIWIELSHLAGEVAQRHLTILLDERVDPRLSPQIGVFLTRVHRLIEVRPSLAPAGQQTLAVKSRHDRHICRVCPRL